jgi:hypothetical protein
MSAASASRSGGMPARGAVARLAVGDGLGHGLDDVRGGGEVDVAQVEGVDGVAAGGPAGRRRGDREGGLGSEVLQPLRKRHVGAPFAKVSLTCPSLERSGFGRLGPAIAERSPGRVPTSQASRVEVLARRTIRPVVAEATSRVRIAQPIPGNRLDKYTCSPERPR